MNVTIQLECNIGTLQGQAPTGEEVRKYFEDLIEGFMEHDECPISDDSTFYVKVVD